MGHLRLAMQIVGRYLYRLKSERLADVLVSAALEGVIDAIHRVSTGDGLTHDNLRGYVTDYIHQFVSKALEDSSSIRVPGRTLRDDKVLGRKTVKPSRVGWDDPSLTAKITQPCDPDDIEIKEIVAKACQSDLERQIVARRQEGMSDTEIGEELELGRTSVFLIRKQVERRFLELFYG